MPRALVTGGAGFIGGHLAHALCAEGWRVDVVDDLSSGCEANVPSECEFIELDLGACGATRRLPRIRYDAVCHLAGQSSGEKSFDDPKRDLDANARSTVVLVEWARDRRIPLLVHASSMGVYGEANGHPVEEKEAGRPISFYGVSKLAAEQALAIAPDVRGVSLRMFSIYGPGQNLLELRQGMVSIYLAMALRGGPIEVRGSLERIRDFVYIDDCVEAWLRAIATGDAVAGPINIGTGVGTSVRTLLAELLKQLGEPEHEIQELPARTPGDQFAVWASTELAHQILGWQAETDLRTGLGSMVRWAHDAQR